MQLVVLEEHRYNRNNHTVGKHYQIKIHGKDGDKLLSDFLESVRSIGGEYIEDIEDGDFNNGGTMPEKSFSGLEARCWCQIITDYLLINGFSIDVSQHQHRLHFFQKNTS